MLYRSPGWRQEYVPVVEELLSASEIKRALYYNRHQHGIAEGRITPNEEHNAYWDSKYRRDDDFEYFT